MITQQEYQARRNKLAQQLPEGSVAIIIAAHEQLRNGDAHYRFRQDSNFYYLTGFNEPDAILVLIAGKESQSILFNRPRNPAAEQWTGRRLGQQGAVEELGMQMAFSIDDVAEELPGLLGGKSAVYFSFARNAELEQLIMDSLSAVKDQVRRGVKAPNSLCDLEPILGEMRLVKSEAELDLMRQAARISVDAHLRAMRQCKEVHNEYQLEA